MDSTHSRYVIGLLLAATLWTQSAPTHATSATPDVWTAYFSSQGRDAAWADTVRGKNRGTLDLAVGADADSEDGPDEPAPATGKNAAQDLIVPLGWGLRSGKDEKQVGELIADMNAHGADARKKALAEQVMRLERNYKSGHIYWQVGNEINGRNLAQSLGRAGGLASSGFDDPAIIPLYAEYIFAPTIEVLEDVSRRLYGDKKRIKVMLGTIANAHRPSSRAWLDQLLAYRIKGSYAPSLANSRVSDHISVIALHYVVTTDDPQWEGIFDELGRKWLATGKVEGIWGTEEIGGKLARSGAGAATAVRVAASYLSRAARLQQSSATLRCSFFGWRWGGEGKSADSGMRLLLTHFGRTRLTDLSDQIRLDAKGNLQGYAFSSIGQEGRRLAVVFSRGTDAGELSEITLPRMGGSAAKRTTAILISSDGSRVVDFAVSTAGDNMHFKLSSPLQLGPGETLLLREGAS